MGIKKWDFLMPSKSPKNLRFINTLVNYKFAKYSTKSS